MHLVNKCSVYLTSGDHNNYDPVWKYSKILFKSNRHNGKGNIWAMNTDSTKQ